MNDEFIKELFGAFDLDEFDAKTYIYLLETSDNNISNIAQQLKTYRVKIYRSLEILKKRKLINDDLSAKSPKILKSLLKQKQYQMSSQFRKFEEYLSKLEDNYEMPSKQIFSKTFEGVNQFVNLFVTILDSVADGVEMLSYNESNDLYKILDTNYFFEIWVQKRVSKNIFNRILVNPNNKYFDTEVKKDSKLLRTTKKLDLKSANQNGCYWVIDSSKIIFWDTEVPKAILIDNSLIGSLLTQQFNQIWDQDLVASNSK